GLDFVLVNFKKGPDVPQHSRFVVHQQNVCCLAHLLFPLLAECATGRRGMMKENLHPAPGSLSTQILPPMPCIKRRAMASPKPMPSDLLSFCGRRKKSSNTSM